MSRWDNKDPIVSLPRSQFRNYLVLFGGLGIIIGFVLSWAVFG
jgi:hypothetical protein